MNTKINYLYRDADNYKVRNECIIRGEMTEEQEKRIIGSLDEETYFVPACVGMPEEKFGSETEADHPWFEWCGTEPTKRKPTLDIDAEELTVRFEKSGNGWQEVRTAPNDGRLPYCVTIQGPFRAQLLSGRARGSVQKQSHKSCATPEKSTSTETTSSTANAPAMASLRKAT